MKKILFLLLLLMMMRVRLAAQDQDNEDVQLWPDVTIGFNVTPKMTVNLFGTARLGRNLHDIVQEQLGTAVNFRLNKYLNIVPSYRHIWSQSNPARHTQENRYFIDVTPRLPLPKGFALVNRNRSEVREINDQVSWRYRTRLQLEKAFTWHDRPLTAYVAEEFFYDSRYHKWNRKQFWAGIRVPVSKQLTFDLHYSRNLDTQARPGSAHIIGLFSRFEF